MYNGKINCICFSSICKILELKSNVFNPCVRKVFVVGGEEDWSTCSGYGKGSTDLREIGKL